ncbi:hypothetical protein [Campylobacter taeniopygiae]|uniref:hypothetical protein n=1 Tax=Campylobacter taeniopygiae TaxID=2510188 RepID=UPI003D6B2F39
MRYKKAFAVIIFLIHIIFFLSFLFLNPFNLNIFFSFEIAFFSILLVIITSYLSYKKMIYSQARKYKINQNLFLFSLKKVKSLPKNIKFTILKDDLEFNIKNKMYFFAVFFNLLKIFAYVVLVAGFLFLHRQGILHIVGYLCGISSLLICIFIFIAYVRYESKKNY